LSERLAVVLAALLVAVMLSVKFAAAPAVPPPPAAAAAVPPPVKAKKRTPRKIAKLPAAVPPANVRGERLREKGEAFGGKAPDRVDKDTTTAH